jgi:hypothetical protein
VITDATLEDIAKHLTHLERLNLKFEIQPDYDGDIAYSHFTDKGLHHLGALDHLKELDLLLAGKFTDGAFTEIARIKGLRKIRVDSFQGTFTDVALEPLRNLLLLEDLNFSGISVSDAGLNLISGLLRLRELKLHGDKHSFTESGVRALLKIPHLTYLHVLGTKFASDKECERIELEFRARKPDGEFNIIDQFGFGARVGARP